MGSTSKIPINDKIDISVVLDPTDWPNTIVAKLLVEQDGGDSPHKDFVSTKLDGILEPIIKLNNLVLDSSMIQYMKIFYDEFIPYISLCVKDYNNLLQLSEVPGMNNVITVVLANSVQGVYKPVKLDFYIDKAQFIGQNMFSCTGLLKFLPFEKQLVTAMKKTNTYDFLYEVAKTTGLGFATTKKCKEIEDVHFRLIRRQKYKDVIPDQLSFSGLDDESIFDCWLDLYGYINLVNVSYVLTVPIQPEELLIHAFLDVNSGDGGIQKPYSETHSRILSNIDEFTSTNLKIERYNAITNNDAITNKGTVQQIQYMCVNGYSTDYSNNIMAEVHKIKENSIDGDKLEDYQFENYEYLGMEMDDVPILSQRKTRERYFDQIRAKKLCITLTLPNLGLIRGMIVTIAIYEGSLLTKNLTTYNFNNTTRDAKSDSRRGSKATPDEHEKISSSSLIMNRLLSGLYYIDGMEFEYNSSSQILKISQKLFLIKRGELSNYINKYSTLQTTYQNTTDVT